jgi:citrate synthase
MTNDLHWKSNITKIKPNEIRIRGYRLDELMGSVSFAQGVYLILRGELPSAHVGKMLDTILITSIDHGTTAPSTLAAITSASTGAPLNAALAAGILSINRHHGGAIEGAMQMLLDLKARAEAEGAGLETVAQAFVAEAREKKKRLPGLGHRLHTDDPRTKKLLVLADELGIAGDYVALMKAVQKSVAAGGKKLPINVDGAVAMLLCELGFEPQLANLFFILARVPGLAAHIDEEYKRQKPMRKIHPTDVGYDGPEDRTLAEESK